MARIGYNLTHVGKDEPVPYAVIPVFPGSGDYPE